MDDIFVRDRSCGTCHACCDGHLSGEAYGHKFWQGRKCFFVNESGCTIYGNHPISPCKNYKCVWLEDKSIPEWMRPDLSKVILTRETINGIPYVSIKEAGQKIDSSILNWIFTQYAEDKFENIRYQIDGGWNWMGSQEFVNAVSKI